MVTSTQRLASRPKKDFGSVHSPSSGLMSDTENKARTTAFSIPTLEDRRKEEESSTTREKWRIRNTPVVNSKFLPVWKRLKAKIKAKVFMKDLNRELQLFGASTIVVESEELKARVSQIVRTRGSPFSNGVELGGVRETPLFVLTPTHWFKGVWNIIVAILLVYTATVTPFRIAFFVERESGSWLVLEYVVNFLFFVDFTVNCLSAYYDADGKVVAGRRAILLNYLKGWMIVDLVACIPFALVEEGTSMTATTSGVSAVSYHSLVRLVRVPRLYRLFRISRLFKALKQRNDYSLLMRLQDFVSVKHSAMRLITFFLTVLVCVHLMSCLWYFAAVLEDLSFDCWVYQYGFQDEDIFSLYIACFYWAFTTLTTVGYGDIAPNTSLERIIAVLWMTFGICFFSFTISSLTSMITNIDTKETVLNTKMAIIDEFSRESKLQRSVRAKLRYAIRYMSEKTGFSWSDKQDIFNELPKDLRYEVAIAMHQGAVRSIPFFEDKNEEFVAAVVPFLLPMFASAETFVYKERDYADEIYFIARGHCALVMLAEGKYVSVKKIQRGSYFGEIEIIQTAMRKYTVQAMTDCDLLVMGKSLLGLIYSEFRGAYRQMEEVAKMRDLLNAKAVKSMREVLRRKKKLTETANGEVQMAKRRTDRSNLQKVGLVRNATEASGIETKMDGEPFSRNVKDKLEGSERKVRIITEMLLSQNTKLRATAGVRKMAALPPLKIPVNEGAKGESSSENSQSLRGET